MTARELERILRRWQRRLGLERWELDVHTTADQWDEGEGGSADAHVAHSPDYLSADVWFNPGTFPSWDDRRAVGVVVHELLHLKLRDLEHAADGLKPQVHRDAWAVFDHLRDRVLERTVDELADRLAELELELQPRRAVRRSSVSGGRKPAPAPRRP